MNASGQPPVEASANRGGHLKPRMVAASAALIDADATSQVPKGMAQLMSTSRHPRSQASTVRFRRCDFIVLCWLLLAWSEQVWRGVAAGTPATCPGWLIQPRSTALNKAARSTLLKRQMARSATATCQMALALKSGSCTEAVTARHGAGDHREKSGPTRQF